MRRGFAGLLLGLSLVLASVAWAGFVTTHTVLDPDRSERLADQVLDNTILRAALVSRLSDSLAAVVPEEVPIPRQTLDEVANTALDDPRVEALVREGIVKTHQNALNGVDEPITLNAGALSEATRDALVEQRPELDAILPAAPPMSVELPTGGLGWLGKLREFINKVMILTAVAALAGATLAMVIAKDRSAILRRVSLWAFGAAAFWLIIGFVIPKLAAMVGPTSTALATAIIDVMFGAMIRPAIYMAMAGGVLFGLSIVWAGIASRRPAHVLQPVRSGQTPQAGVRPAPSPVLPRVPSPSRSEPVVDRTQIIPQPATTPPLTQPQTPAPLPSQTSSPAAYPGKPNIAAPSTETPASDGNKQWVAGVGYVEDDESA